jgi:hypothetical protein
MSGAPIPFSPSAAGPAPVRRYRRISPSPADVSNFRRVALPCSSTGRLRGLRPRISRAPKSPSQIGRKAPTVRGATLGTVLAPILLGLAGTILLLVGLLLIVVGLRISLLGGLAAFGMLIMGFGVLLLAAALDGWWRRRKQRGRPLRPADRRDD